MSEVKSEATARAEARRKKILEKGADRMAIATGQKEINSSRSWRRKKLSSCASENSNEQDGANANCIKYTSTGNDELEVEKNPNVEKILIKCESQVKEIPEEEMTILNLNAISNNKDASDVIPGSDVGTKEESAKRVAEAIQDYNPVERDESRAKRRALEQEIVRQTEEFDRLTELSKNSGKSVVIEKDSEDVNEDRRESDVSTNSYSFKWHRNISHQDCLYLVRFVFLVMLGGILGYFSVMDTNHSYALYPSAIGKYSSSYCRYDDSPKDEYSDSDIVSSHLPSLWRESSSYFYVLLHYPVVVVLLVRYISKYLMLRFFLADSAEGSQSTLQGFLNSCLALATGNMSVITTPLLGFLGEISIFLLALIFTGSSLSSQSHQFSSSSEL